MGNSNNAKNGSSSTVSMAQLLAAVNDNGKTTRACQQLTSEQLAELGRAQQSGFDRFMSRMDEHENNMSKGMTLLNESICHGAARAVRATEEAEGRLSKKIDSIKGRTLSAIDYITVLIVAILSGVAGWFFSNCMIQHEFAAWVDRVEKTDYVRDAAGNWVDVIQTTTTQTVWPTVILTIALFVIVGTSIAFAVVESISEE